MRLRRAPSVAVLRLKPGDTLVISSDEFLTQMRADQIKASAVSSLPDGTKVIVLNKGMGLSVVQAVQS